MGTGANRIFNIVTLVVVLLTAAFIGWVALTLASPRPVDPAAALLPTNVTIPTLTPTDARPTLPPTWTPSVTNTLTPTPTLTATFTPSLTPTITDTPGPTFTPSNTPTASVSPTFTPSFTPTGPTLTPSITANPFPFQLREGIVRFDFNRVNSAGCAWQGIAGQVRDEVGNELAGLTITVFNDSFQQAVITGSNSLYGTLSGWEVKVADQINNLTYFVVLSLPSGTQVSDRVQVTFPQNCNQNLAYVDFIQVR